MANTLKKIKDKHSELSLDKVCKFKVDWVLVDCRNLIVKTANNQSLKNGSILTR